MSSMAVIHVTRDDAVRDIDSLLRQAASGQEILIESEPGKNLVLGPSWESSPEEQAESGHEEWVAARLGEARADKRPGISAEDVRARSEKKFREAARVSPRDPQDKA